jgi:hypothetical protein
MKKKHCMKKIPIRINVLNENMTNLKARHNNTKSFIEAK